MQKSLNLLLVEELERLESSETLEENTQVSRLSGSVDAYAQSNTFRTEETAGILMTIVSNRTGTVGYVEFDMSMGQAIYMNPQGGIEHRERITNRPTKRQLEQHFVPALLRHVSTMDMFGT